MNKLCFQSTTFISNGIVAIIEGTRTKNRGTIKKRSIAKSGSFSKDAHCNNDVENNGFASSSCELHSNMNTNQSLCCPKDSEHTHHSLLSKMDTKVYACSRCNRELLGKGAFQIHCKESHQAPIAEEADGTQNDL